MKGCEIRKGRKFRRSFLKLPPSKLKKFNENPQNKFPLLLLLSNFVAVYSMCFISGESKASTKWGWENFIKYEASVADEV